MKLVIASVFAAGCLLPGLACSMFSAENPQAAALVEVPLPQYDFTQPATLPEWRPAHDIGAWETTPQGLQLQISGADPYFIGPSGDYPADTKLWLRVRLKSDQGGGGQVFYSRADFSEADSVRFNVPANEWSDVRIAFPALGPGYHLRIDPPGSGGKVVFASIRFERRVLLPPPRWPAWETPKPHAQKLIGSGELDIFLGPESLRGFEVRVKGLSMGFEQPRPRIGYMKGREVQWLDCANDPKSEASLARQAMSRVQTLTVLDPQGAQWKIERHFFTGAVPGTIHLETRVTVDQDRLVVYLPLLILVAGDKSFGTNATQGLFAGLEYLDHEPSSSEADLTGPAAKRQVPVSRKITFPLMTLVAERRYLGLIWEEPSRFSALFDSPDRIFGSGGHLMGILFPGSDGVNRQEGDVLPYYGEVLKARQPLVFRATLIGGEGSSVVPAIQQYVKLNGLPDLPGSARQSSNYFALAASGWLDSKIREGAAFRHAVWPGFGSQPAADAAVFMDWLASQSSDVDLKARLTEAARGTLSLIKPENFNATTIGHVRYSVPSLVYGQVGKNADHAKATAENSLNRFSSDGSVRYQKPASGPDYGKTHFAPDANGLTAQVVVQLLESAAFAGDRGLIDKAIGYLRALNKFTNCVPRGAQTWEVPLHTPDILASAHLVRAYTLGYELTGEREFLEQAIYWAWTGVPFVYLANPTGQAVGPYSTIAVYGATSWKDPVWFGRPVQWCGMVYADALYRLVRYDPKGPWRKLADGITAAGIQHNWPASDGDRQGLLPDFFELPTQTRAGPAINPGTVMASAVRLFGKTPIYDFRCFRKSGLLVHAPGEIVPERDQPGSVKFKVNAWPVQPYFILVNGLTPKPKVKLDGKEITLAPPNEFQPASGRLILILHGKSTVEVFK